MNAHPTGRPQRRRPGRPATVSADAIASAALSLFIRDGFEQTTMSQVAGAAGVGRKTLFAYFPTKADIVWNRFKRQLQDLEAALAQTPPGVSPTDAVVAAVLQGLHMGPEDRTHLRSELVLIAANPSLEAYAHVAGKPWRVAIADFLAARSGQSPDGVLPRVLGLGFWEAMFVGFDRWLESRATAPLAHVRAALLEYAKAIEGAFDPQ